MKLTIKCICINIMFTLTSGIHSLMMMAVFNDDLVLALTG